MLQWRRGRISVERSPCDNLADNDASASSPQRLAGTLERNYIKHWNTHRKYWARIDTLMDRRSLVCAYDGQRS